MKALSVRQPWAELLISGRKPEENRSWRTHYRGPLILHASMTHDHECGAWLSENNVVLEQAVPYGVIIGLVQLVDCVHIDKLKNPTKFAFGPWCWIMAKPRRLPKPIPYMGKLGLFDITEPYVLEQLPQ